MTDIVTINEGNVLIADGGNLRFWQLPETVDPKTQSNTWPADAPPPAIAPFDAQQAKQHQEAWAKYLGREVETTNSIGMKMRLIPPGEFMMGTEKAEIDRRVKAAEQLKQDDYFIEILRKEGPQHQVRLTQPFLMSTHEVTRGEFASFVKATGYRTEAERDGGRGSGLVKGEEVRQREFRWNTDLGFVQTDQHPVVNISWNDANAFCAWLSKEEVVMYRLPTEAEWEFACRAGTTGQWSLPVAQGALLEDYAWYYYQGQKDNHPIEVGTKFPNPFGLTDMHGNVHEWCLDGLRAYASGLAIDPKGIVESARSAFRGGSYSSYSKVCRSAARHSGPPRDRSMSLGFRVVASIAPTTKTTPAAAEPSSR